MTRKCVICQRIPPKEVAKVVHQVFQNITPKDLLHQIILDCCEKITYADKENRTFFCGRPQRTILGGLLYLEAIEYGLRLTQAQVAERVGVLYSHGASSVRTSYFRWFTNFPRLFPKTNLAIEKGELEGTKLGLLVPKWKSEWQCKCGLWHDEQENYCSHCYAFKTDAQKQSKVRRLTA